MRCEDCKHYLELQVLDHDAFDADFGGESALDLEGRWGYCEWDAPAIVRHDNDEYERTGEECWERRS